jgi:hypothetical protein
VPKVEIDDSAEFSEINIQLDIKAASSSGGIDGLDSLSSDDTLLYVSIGGGTILVILLIVVFIRVVTKSKPKTNNVPQVTQPIILPDEPSEVSGDEDFDDFFSDLDQEPSSGDEFDDLFNDL